MSVLIWILRGILFVILLGLAIKNSSDVELRFFFDASWHAPLSLVVLISIVFGAVIGLLVMLPKIIQQYRSISALKRLPAADVPAPVIPPVDG